MVVEKCGNLGDPRALPAKALAACSACAGDYEDPDRTAWADDQLDEPIDDDDQGDALSPARQDDDRTKFECGKSDRRGRWKEKRR